ncbi:MAG: YraN family protein [Solirubrobacteraceae bacterium]
MADDPRRALGALGEQLASDHLTRLGFRIVERNFRTRWGELDIIAATPGALIFCEVKTRIARAPGRDPLESVHPRKRLKVRRMAAQWLSERPDHPRAAELRFDAVGVTLTSAGRLLALEHLEGAF